MKFIVEYIVYYENRYSVKTTKVKKCDDETHCKSKFNKWVSKKYKNAKSVELVSCNLDSVIDSKNAIFESFKDIFGTALFNGK